MQLIDASKCYIQRRKPIGNKRVDITKEARDLIVKAYGAYRNDSFEAEVEGGHKLVVKTKVLSTMSLGYNKITVESPLTDENGKPILKKGKMQPDASKRDTENVPLDEDMDAYFEREVKPYSPDAWIDHDKYKVGYEIPFTRTFYEYKAIESASLLAAKIEAHEQSLMSKLQGFLETVVRMMRDSGQNWLGTIPSTWGLSRIGSLYSLRNEKVSDKDYPPLSVTMKGVVPQLESAAKSDDGDNRKLVKIGDFAINSRSDAVVLAAFLLTMVQYH